MTEEKCSQLTMTKLFLGKKGKSADLESGKDIPKLFSTPKKYRAKFF